MEECGGCAFGKKVMVGWCNGYGTSMDEVGVLNMATCMYIHTYIGPFPLLNPTESSANTEGEGKQRRVVSGQTSFVQAQSLCLDGHVPEYSLPL